MRAFAHILRAKLYTQPAPTRSKHAGRASRFRNVLGLTADRRGGIAWLLLPAYC